MNSEKILIEINVAGVNRSFDCIVPRTLSAKLLCRGFLELVEQSMGIPFGAYRQALLSGRTAASVVICAAERSRAAGLCRLIRTSMKRGGAAPCAEQRAFAA